MPAKSAAQRRLMQAALHGATFKKAKDIRKSMSPSQIRDFTHTNQYAKRAAAGKRLK